MNLLPPHRAVRHRCVRNRKEGGGEGLARHACASINLTRVICVSVTYMHIYRPIINFWRKGGGLVERGSYMYMYIYYMIMRRG